MGKLAAFSRLSMADRVLYLEATTWLGFAWFAKTVLPYKQATRFLRSTGREKGPKDVREAATVARVGRAVTVMSQHVPWTSLCLVQALAARMMLRLRGIGSTVYIGVARDENQGDLLSHAWLCSGDLFVTGEEGHERFEVITTFQQ